MVPLWRDRAGRSAVVRATATADSPMMPSRTSRPTGPSLPQLPCTARRSQSLSSSLWPSPLPPHVGSRPAACSRTRRAAAHRARHPQPRWTSCGTGRRRDQVPAAWDRVAPGDKTQADGLRRPRPGEVPAGAPTTALVSAAQAHGFRVMVALSPPVPGWATKRGDSPGVDRPSAREYGRFAEAAGKRYPSVDMWTLWNEPNHPGFLYPQSSQRHAATRRDLYRGLVPGAVAGLKRARLRRRHDPLRRAAPDRRRSTSASTDATPLALPA